MIIFHMSADLAFVVRDSRAALVDCRVEMMTPVPASLRVKSLSHSDV